MYGDGEEHSLLNAFCLFITLLLLSCILGLLLGFMAGQHFAEFREEFKCLYPKDDYELFLDWLPIDIEPTIRYFNNARYKATTTTLKLGRYSITMGGYGLTYLRDSFGTLFSPFSAMSSFISHQWYNAMSPTVRFFTPSTANAAWSNLWACVAYPLGFAGSLFTLRLSGFNTLGSLLVMGLQGLATYAQLQ